MVLFAYILTLVFGLINGELSDIVETTNGPVQGEILTTVTDSVRYSSFKGIPYAEAPLGYNRFKPPIEKKSWSKLLLTTKEGSNCVQIDFVYRNLTGREDCLYLNVYSPHTNLTRAKVELKPVMVWIYGGSFRAGYGNSSLYGPDFIIQEGIVLVTFNYRLGPFGFMSLGHRNATGNAGLKDQNLVLKWIKKNIIQFGGNPENVTIFGQSAGGVAVDFHSLSEMSRDLFHRSISMSASVFCPWAFHLPQAALRQAFKLGKSLGIETSNKEELLKFLYKTPASDIMEKTEHLSTIYPPFKPTLEDPNIAPKEELFMTECYLKKYETGNFYQVPHLTGFTSQESVYFASGVDKINQLANQAILEILSLEYLRRLPTKVKSYLNRKSKKINNFSSLIISTLVNETSDLMFVAGIDTKQRLLTESQLAPVYYYRLIFDTEESLHKVLYHVNLNGTAHGDDFAYLFYISLANPPLDPNDRVSITRKRIVRMWTNFAKFGNPTPLGEDDKLLNVKWLDSGRTGQHLEIGEELKMRKNRPISSGAEIYQISQNILAPQQSGCKLNIPKFLTWPL